jgi:hypothetical protein
MKATQFLGVALVLGAALAVASSASEADVALQPDVDQFEVAQGVCVPQLCGAQCSPNVGICCRGACFCCQGTNCPRCVR